MSENYGMAETASTPVETPMLSDPASSIEDSANAGDAVVSKIEKNDSDDEADTARVEDSAMHVSEPQASEKGHDFSPLLNQIDEALERDRYSSALIYLKDMMDKIEEKQERVIDQFFPTLFTSYARVKRVNDSSYAGLGGDGFGVLYEKSFKNKRGHAIDVNVVFLDNSIREYVRIIGNPSLVKGIENASVMTIQDRYRALRKDAQEQRFYELNIVVNSDILVNVIGVGMGTIKPIERFSEEIDFNGLQGYLKTQ